MRGVPVRSDINALEILPRVARAKKRSAKGQFRVCDNVGKSCLRLPLHTHLFDADHIGRERLVGLVGARSSQRFRVHWEKNASALDLIDAEFPTTADERVSRASKTCQYLHKGWEQASKLINNEINQRKTTVPTWQP